MNLESNNEILINTIIINTILYIILKGKLEN